MVEDALEHILAWPGLARSPQLANFLKYIVEQKLRGVESNIKAYSIAVDVFGRPADFDPQADPIVRVQARRLRAVLEEFYASEPETPADVRFYLPVGRYVPEWVTPGDEDSAALEGERSDSRPVPERAAAPHRRGDILLMSLVAVLALALVVLLSQILQPRATRLEIPSIPSISVAEFTSVTPSSETRLAGLAVELVTDLELFKFILPSYLLRQGGRAMAPRVDFELTGIVRSDGPNMQITASLRRSGSDSVVWSKSVIADERADRSIDVDEISRAFAQELGSTAGPLHADMMRWLEATPDIAGSEGDYLCSMLWELYDWSGLESDFARAESCAEALFSRVPGSATAGRLVGLTVLERAWKTGDPDAVDGEMMAEAGRLIQEAVDREPTSSDAWTALGLEQYVTGRFRSAEESFASALQLNPANLAAVAAQARTLLMQGHDERAEELAVAALSQHLSPPYWFYEALALDALRHDRPNAALDYSERLVMGDAELGSVIAVAAAAALEREDVLDRYIAQMLEVTRFRRYGILPVLQARIPDEQMVETLAADLREVGIPQTRLVAGY